MIIKIDIHEIREVLARDVDEPEPRDVGRDHEVRRLLARGGEEEEPGAPAWWLRFAANTVTVTWPYRYHGALYKMYAFSLFLPMDSEKDFGQLR